MNKHIGVVLAAVIVGGSILGAAYGLLAGAPRATAPPAYAVFAEHSPVSKRMQPGMNTRVFNKVEVNVGDAIRLDERTGVITLAPGTYHITGFSATVYYTGKEPPEMISTRDPANGGYCRLWDRKETDLRNNGRAIVVGSASTANAVPSLVEAYFTTAEPAEIIMEHQSGSSVKDVYLQVHTMNSPWHVFARICIRRL